MLLRNHGNNLNVFGLYNDIYGGICGGAAKKNVNVVFIPDKSGANQQEGADELVFLGGPEGRTSIWVHVTAAPPTVPYPWEKIAQICASGDMCAERQKRWMCISVTRPSA